MQVSRKQERLLKLASFSISWWKQSTALWLWNLWSDDHCFCSFSLKAVKLTDLILNWILWSEEHFALMTHWSIGCSLSQLNISRIVAILNCPVWFTPLLLVHADACLQLTSGMLSVLEITILVVSRGYLNFAQVFVLKVL